MVNEVKKTDDSSTKFVLKKLKAYQKQTTERTQYKVK